MNRNQAIKALFNQSRTEAMFGTESAKFSRIMSKKRQEAKKLRELQRIAERETPRLNG